MRPLLPSPFHSPTGLPLNVTATCLGPSAPISNSSSRASKSGVMRSDSIARAGSGPEPHRLPDPRRGREEDRLGRLLPVLLPARDRLVGERVFGAHDELVVVLADHMPDVRGEGRVAALVARDLFPIDPDGGAVVHGSEVQQQTV